MLSLSLTLDGLSKKPVNAYCRELLVRGLFFLLTVGPFAILPLVASDNADLSSCFCEFVLGL